MNQVNLFHSVRPFLAGLISAIVLAAACANAAEDLSAEFSKPIIDLGVVVRDMDKAAQFYTNALGFREVQGFTAPADFTRKIGLTGSAIGTDPVKIRVFVLGDGNLATRVKLLSFPQAPGKEADQTYIHSSYGLRYLTLYVTSADRALARLQKAGVKTLGETPVKMESGARLIALRDPDGNFIELIGP